MKYLVTCFFISVSQLLQGQTAIKMEKQGGVFVLPCKVNGLNLKFIMDTGASDVSISLTEAAFMLKNDYMSEKDLIGTTYYQIADGNVMEGTEVILREIEIGGKKLYNVKASISHSLSAPLLLGQSALSKLGKIQVDYSNNTLIIGGSNLSQSANEMAKSKQEPTYADSDNDNVPDNLDKCPYKKGDPKNNGCPIILVDLPDMVFIQGGTYQMGSDRGKRDEMPVHNVTLNNFYIGRNEVTFDEGCSSDLSPLSSRSHKVIHQNFPSI
jgi:clan AA aspartic protease (TIGR02281 family)